MQMFVATGAVDGVSIFNDPDDMSGMNREDDISFGDNKS
jgi:hypothetical protein